MGLSLYTAELIGALGESLLYGLMLPLAIRILTTLERRRRNGSLTNARVFQTITCVMIFMATVHLTGEWIRMIYANYKYEDREEASKFLVDARSWQEPIKSFPYTFQTLTGDTILVYRCYIIWNKNKWITIFPFLPLLVAFVCNVVTIGLILSRQYTSILIGHLYTVILVAFACTVGTTIVSTTLILTKIWLVKRQLRTTTKDIFVLTPSLRVFIESGAIYTITMSVLFGMFLARVEAQIVVFDLVNPLIPLLFCSVMLSISEGGNTFVKSSTENLRLSLSTGSYQHPIV